LIRRLTASNVNGPLRSVANTKALSADCRRSSRSARSSSPRSRCADGSPFLTRQRGSSAELDLRPFEVRSLGGTETMAIGDQNQGRLWPR
jgi:hypothetical protein